MHTSASMARTICCPSQPFRRPTDSVVAWRQWVSITTFGLLILAYATQGSAYVLDAESSPSVRTTLSISQDGDERDALAYPPAHSATDCDSVAIPSRSPRGKSTPNILVVNAMSNPQPASQTPAIASLLKEPATLDEVYEQVNSLE